jgi:serine/threonine-protein kinase
MYAAPYAGVADAFSYLGHYGLVPTPQAAPKAIGAAERAVALDDGLADAHFSLGLAKLFFWYLDEAESELRRAIALNPQHGVARAYLGVYLASTGRAAEVEGAVEPAREREPLSPIVNGVAGIAYFWARDYAPALEAFNRALEIDPTFIPALYMRGTILALQGNHAEGVADLEKAAQALPCPLILQLLGGAYADAGRLDDARGMVARLRKQREESYATAESIGYILAKLGDTDEALDWLQKAFDERNTFAWAGSSWGGMERVAAHPRYVGMLEKAGLARFTVAPLSHDS